MNRAASSPTPSASSSKEDRLRQKEQQAKERKRQNDIERTQKRIDEIDSEISEIDELLSLPEVFTDPAKSAEYAKKREELVSEQEKLYDVWEELEKSPV